ncbi:ras-related C3 botulinum toxin substrate 1-like [Anneissia japonica]|uniref:ras-related C3 botulinum toxin substrate 1-like n=1 Tax=Anneissia japonica TaxID=1529436 RepID=UPI0014259970|nr:ras-related C3 botulinum toxin substrate 1-like [Anneissia japonica]
MAQDSNVLKCVVVGDGAVGKRSMLCSYTLYHFSAECIPTIFDNYSLPMKVDGVSVNLCLFNMSGMEGRLRPLSYPQTDIFLVCFSVVGQSSYANVQTIWHPELAHHAPGVPYVLVGTKVDLREDKEVINELNSKGKKVYSKEDGETLANKIGAAKYMECSALTERGLKMVFEEAVRIALYPPPIKDGKRKRCRII